MNSPVKKSPVALAISVVAAVAFLVTGCDKLSNAQVKVIAQQAGIASVATWIGVDNPSADQKAVAAEIVGVIKSNAVLVVAGSSYYEVLNPVVSTYVDSKVKEQYRPIAKLAGGWVLTGVDTFFAMYPQYGSNTTFAVEVVGSFCDGATLGLAMTKDDPVIKAATRGVAERTKTRKSVLSATQ